jgi:hypothetical protein
MHIFVPCEWPTFYVSTVWLRGSFFHTIYKAEVTTIKRSIEVEGEKRIPTFGIWWYFDE